MTGFVISFLVGVLCIVLGIGNMRGNISSLHSYHRSRVSDEDRIPFGKRVGLGTVLCGAAIVALSMLSAISLYTENPIFSWIGMAIGGVGLAIGIAVACYAMIKYNKGIF